MLTNELMPQVLMSVGLLFHMSRVNTSRIEVCMRLFLDVSTTVETRRNPSKSVETRRLYMYVTFKLWLNLRSNFCDSNFFGVIKKCHSSHQSSVATRKLAVFLPTWWFGLCRHVLGMHIPTWTHPRFQTLGFMFVWWHTVIFIHCVLLSTKAMTAYVIYISATIDRPLARKWSVRLIKILLMDWMAWRLHKWNSWGLGCAFAQRRGEHTLVEKF